MTIPLGVRWGRIHIRNPQIIAVSAEEFSIKLKSIVRDEDMRDPKPSDNVFLDKIFGVNISDIRQGLSFNSFGAIVYADHKSLLFPAALGKGSTISKPYWANGQGLDRGLRTHPS